MMQPRELPPLSEERMLLAPAERQLATLSAGPPILIVAVDTEAEFDWNGPFLRTQTSVANIRSQRMAQDIYQRFGVRPIYLVDYAVATTPEGYGPLREIAQSGGCEIGAHLHPWITPPFVEELSDRTSFSHNLPAQLQKEKFARLTEAIVSSFGVRPISYRAGRYGVGEEIAEILDAFDYRIDMSVQTGIDMRRVHGPDFQRALDRPYWFGQRLLEIPATPGFVGLLARRTLPRSWCNRFYNRLLSPSLVRLHLPGVFARSHLLDRIPLSPEGVGLGELRRVTQSLLARGNRTFVFSYHSSSLLPGSTEYVRSPSELSQFLRTIEGYLEFFFRELGGVAMTPSEFRAALLDERGDRLLSPSGDQKPIVPASG